MLRRPPKAGLEARALAFAGRHVLITGGGTGIGAAIAAAFAAEGAAVTLLGRRTEPLAEQAKALAAAGARTHFASCDVTDAAAVEASFAEAARQLGPIEILVNNAGMAESAPLSRVTPEMLQRILAVNLTQLFTCTQQVLPAMLAAGFGRIVNIASTAALAGYPYVTAYCAAKHGVLGFTRALAMEVVRSGVTVNAVCPGYTDTPLVTDAIEAVRRKTKRSAEEVRASITAVNPMGRMIEPAEVASAVLWVASPSSTAITGQAIPVAGGEIFGR